jgi:hypothetical protein
MNKNILDHLGSLGFAGLIDPFLWLSGGSWRRPRQHLTERFPEFLKQTLSCGLPRILSPAGFCAEDEQPGLDAAADVSGRPHRTPQDRSQPVMPSLMPLALRVDEETKQPLQTRVQILGAR